MMRTTRRDAGCRIQDAGYKMQGLASSQILVKIMGLCPMTPQAL